MPWFKWAQHIITHRKKLKDKVNAIKGLLKGIITSHENCFNKNSNKSKCYKWKNGHSDNNYISTLSKLLKESSLV